MCSSIKTPCNLVYLKGNVFEVKDCIDPKRKEEIWGIQIGDVIWQKKALSNCDWYSGRYFFDHLEDEKNQYMCKLQKFERKRELIAENGNVEVALSMPTVDDLSKLFMHKEDFALTVALLAANSVEAEDMFDGWYWGEEFSKIKAHVFGSDGTYSVKSKNDSFCILRMCYKPVSKQLTH